MHQGVCIFGAGHRSGWKNLAPHTCALTPHSIFQKGNPVSLRLSGLMSVISVVPQGIPVLGNVTAPGHIMTPHFTGMCAGSASLERPRCFLGSCGDEKDGDNRFLPVKMGGSFSRGKPWHLTPTPTSPDTLLATSDGFLCSQGDNVELCIAVVVRRDACTRHVKQQGGSALLWESPV